MTIRKKYIIALVSIYFSFGLISATNVEIDSLKSKLAKSEIDKRILIFSKIADLHKFVNSDLG